MVPGVTSISFRVLSRVHMTHLGFGTSHFGLDGDPKRAAEGKTNCQMVVSQALLPPCSSCVFTLSHV